MTRDFQNESFAVRLYDLETSPQTIAALIRATFPSFLFLMIVPVS